jgi:hypothetical protein
MARGIADTTIERELVFPQGSAAAFRACLGTRGGECRPGSSFAAPAQVAALDTSTPAMATTGAAEANLMLNVGASMARDVLDHPVQRKINDFYNYLRGVDRGELVSSLREATPTLRLDMRELDDYMMDIEAATLADGWSALAAQPVAPGRLADSRRRLFLKAYFEAYFRNGEFYQFNLNANGLAARIREQAKKGLPFLDDGQIDALIEELLEKRFHLVKDADGRYPSVPLFGTLGTGGFVTRGGASYSFPSIEAQLDPAAERPVQVSEVDFTAVGADLIRVLLHAIFDEHDGLPAVSNATGIGIPQPDGLLANEPGLPGHLSAENFGSVEAFAGRIEGVTGAVVGRAVRGVSWIALNNEALAVLIETTVGVAARKFAEKASWCWYSCGFGGAAVAQPVLSAAPPARVRLLVSGPASLLEQERPWESR